MSTKLRGVLVFFMALPQVLIRAVLLCWCRRLDAVLFVGTGQIETSTRSTSAVLLSPSVDFIEELQCAQHCRGSFNLVGGQRI